jgi:putative ABC transport system permease protein
VGTVWEQAADDASRIVKRAERLAVVYLLSNSAINEVSRRQAFSSGNHRKPALGAGGRWFESSGPDQISIPGFHRGSSQPRVPIVGNTRIDGPEGRVKPEAYLPMAQTGIFWGTLEVRRGEPPASLTGPLRAIVSAVAPDAQVGALESLDETFGHLVAARRLSMLLFAMFGVLAMAIAAVGIYGVVSCLVEQRTKEIGVRMALGATPGRILRQLLGQFAWVLGGGVTLGLLAAWSLARFVAAFLFEVPAHAVGVYAAVSTAVVLTGLLATVLPARRAAKVDPPVALRAE